MQVSVGSQIRITKPHKELVEWCNSTLTLRNPEYEKKKRMGFWLGKTPEKIRLFQWDGDVLLLPYGCLRTVMRHKKQNDVVKVDMVTPKPVWFGCDIPLYDYQKEAVAKMLEAQYGILKAAAGSGKGLPLYAKIYTPDGFTRNGDLSIGDKVLNPHGGISRVTAIYDRGKQVCYKITFTDDSTVVCDKDHLWQVRNTRKRNKEWEVLDTNTIYRLGVCDSHGNRQWEIPIARPVQFSERNVTIEPWLLGILLGDGSFCGNEVSISNPEPDIMDRVSKIVKCPLYQRKERVSTIICDKGSLKYRLFDYGLQGLHSWEKFIPKEYRYNSVSVRLKVLQGLIDSDGSVDGSEVTLTSTSRRLVEDCLEIAQSLGGTGKISTRHTKYTYKGEVKEGRESYRLSLKLYNFEAFSSEKHKRNATQRSKYASAYRRIKAIEITAPRETRCISVDSDDELYLTDGFVVTHNTQCGIALAAALGRRTLWLCHTLDLVKQSKQRAEMYMDADLTGTITEGKVNIGKAITFATVQTMAHLDLAQYRDTWDCIICDECHRIHGGPTTITQYYKVLNALAARHKYGLSATVHRADGMIAATYALVGEVAYSVPDEAVKSKIMQVSILPRYTGVEPSMDFLDTDGTIIYSKLVNYLTECDDRNRMIVADLVKNRQHFNLILSDRLNHLRELMDSLPDDLREQAVMIDGKMTSKKGKAQREQAIEDMRNGNKRYLFATYSLAKEGLDVPRLDRLYLTTPQKDYAVITQSVGRVARTFDGKGEPISYDYVDDGIKYLVKNYKKRCTTYRKCKCRFIDPESGV